ncbi:MAG: hypothetical protein PUA95_08345 [Lactimicrobium massiliense]|nr:hypothetical protein [Lactimicrobium massiliense]MDD6230730.1 hypothetical protein [Lactimicrobium massiliense]MDD6726865.1 hypothetical protein [Lactimicrobium massiliense]
MKNVYPVFIQKDGEDYLAYIPDVDSYTSGKSFYEAMYMARDLLGTISLEKELPAPSAAEDACKTAAAKADEPDFKYSSGTLAFVDIDTDEYKRKLDNRAVKKNCTIPSWLNDKAEAAGVNFSRVLQEALIERLK